MTAHTLDCFSNPDNILQLSGVYSVLFYCFTINSIIWLDIMYLAQLIFGHVKKVHYLL